MVGKKMQANRRVSQMKKLVETEDLVLERLVRLEERQTGHINSTRQNFAETKELIAGQHKQIEMLAHSLEKYKGFWGGISLVISGIMAFVIMFKDVLASRFGAN